MKQLTEAQLEGLLRAAYSAGFDDRGVFEKEFEHEIMTGEFPNVGAEFLRKKEETIKHLAGQV